MALTGTYQRTLDDKQRLAVPRPMRDELVAGDSQDLYLAPETDQALALFSSAAFERRAARLEEASRGSQNVRNYLRLYYSQAERVTLDSQGRIRIPERLVGFAHLATEVVLLGVHDHVEVWDRETWDGFLNRHTEEFDRLAEEAFR
ncbi:cell division protein [Maioricimonas sp. JC845]|uniref:division/cell wall cluster transcriptional repressor MraZ n=1 Tax=Maioricimonas sp. JC845 TaxID=3232138 RepID=UPI0034579DE1